MDKISKWNLNKNKGWEIYKKATEKGFERIKNCIDDYNIPIDEVMVKFENVHDQLKFQSFGKIYVRKKSDTKNDIVNDHNNENTVDNANDLAQKQSERLYDEINNIKKNNKGRVSQVFKLMSIIQG